MLPRWRRALNPATPGSAFGLLAPAHKLEQFPASANAGGAVSLGRRHSPMPPLGCSAALAALATQTSSTRHRPPDRPPPPQISRVRSRAALTTDALPPEPASLSAC